MIVWRITGNEVGPNGNGAAHFATKREADKARRECPGCEPPERLAVKNRAELARALDEAMGYGAA